MMTDKQWIFTNKELTDIAINYVKSDGNQNSKSLRFSTQAEALSYNQIGFADSFN